MKNKKLSLLIQTGVILAYMLFFILMKNLFDSHQNDLNTMAAITVTSLRVHIIRLYSITFFQWFFLGVLLSFLNFKNWPGFSFSTPPFLIAIGWFVISILGTFPILGILIFYQSGYLEFFHYVTPIFTGFFLFKSLFTESLNQQET
ncbi:hypothetical protein [Acetobacterium bakii]|uniref:Uncharacterized protein n=1 Tax=Acetobacterium bakii TaxID=52689 RepID=A0A0L6U1C1_9FIRM|nr:hypothetical protein [Acetobacterium bakii]KNZ42316.1 hypothetical protein AKG39_07335 [Acetobacterium bakii]